MRAMIFAAGFGTRMRPVSEHLPKPAIPFLGRPLIAHLYDWLLRHGVDEVVINLHHLPERMRRVATVWRPSDLTVHFSHEEDILGTGGGLMFAREYFCQDPAEFLVVNGDVYTELDVEPTIVQHRASPALATLALTRDPYQRELFGVDLDPAGRVVGFWGGGGAAHTRAAYTGIHVCSPAIFDVLPSSGFACLKADGWIPALAAGHTISGTICEGMWADMGTPHRYMEALLRSRGFAPPLP